MRWSAVLLWMIPVLGSAVEVITWNKVPIPLRLEVGVERILDFGAPVEVGAPAYLAQGRLRTQSTGGVVYWKAAETFETRRVQIKNAQTGQLMLFDLSAVAASKAPNAEPIKVVMGGATPAVTQPGQPGETSAEPEPLGPIGLIRYASRQFYAPKRLRGGQPDITRVPMRLPKTLTALFHGHLNQQLHAEPQAAWRSATDGLYVTAIRLTNRGTEPLLLDYRTLSGEVLYATFQHGDVGPKGTDTETTLLYLVTEHEPGASLARGE